MGNRSRAVCALVTSTMLVSLAACRTRSVEEAEQKGNVRWLDVEGSPAAVGALGRLADKDSKARAAVEAKAQAGQASAYIAAWEALLRRAPWAETVLRQGLQDPEHADKAAGAMTRRAPQVVPFLGDLGSAMAKLGSSNRSAVLAGLIASAGPAAAPVVEARLADGGTRAAMCRGLAITEASLEARAVLRSSPGYRDDPACLDVLMKLAADDASWFTWLAKDAEPGLLSAAGKDPSIPCRRLTDLWKSVMDQRAPETYGALTVPLSHGLRRCSPELDGVVASNLRKHPKAHAFIVGAVDPYAGLFGSMPLVCGELAILARSRGPALVQERALDAITHGCRP